MNELYGARRDFSRIGFAVFVMMVIIITLGQAAAWIISLYFGEDVLAIPWVSIAISAGVQYLIAMPVAFLMIRGLRKQDAPQFKITFGKFCILFLISYFLMYAGNLIGIGTTSLIQYFTDSTLIPLLEDVFSGVNLYIYMLFVVVAAPIVEELFFRKLLISRMERYGEAPAIIVSALIFGIFHGNLTQGFYAVALGLLLGYVYIRTRKILITIGLHMLINLISGTLLPLAVNSGSLWAIPAALAALGFSISGLVMFIIRVKKINILPREGQLPMPGWGQFAFANAGMIFFFVSGAAIIVLSTIGMLVPN